MTYFHFLNCLTLTFGPLVLTYRTTALSEVKGYPSLLSIFFYYLILQAFKLFILACLPSSLLGLNDITNDGFSILVEISRILLDLFISIFGMIYSYRNARYINKMQPFTLRILCVGLGWSFSHSITHYLIPLWSARGIEFNWGYIFMGIKSNLYFLLSIALANMLYYDYMNISSLRKGKVSKKNKSSFSLLSALPSINTKTYFLFAVSASIPSICEFLHKVLFISSANCILVQIILTLMIVLFVYVSVGIKILKSD
eukprot:185044_1